MKKTSKKLTSKQNKRPSPTPHASEHKYKVIKGNDGNDYISKPDKNQIFKWKKIKPMSKTKTPYEFYSQYQEREQHILYNIDKFINGWNLATRELAQSNIILLEIGWKKIGSFIDFAWEKAHEYMQKKYNNSTYSLLFYTENSLYNGSINGIIDIQHDILRKDKDLIIKVLKKYFNVNWTGKTTNSIQIKLSKL